MHLVHAGRQGLRQTLRVDSHLISIGAGAARDSNSAERVTRLVALLGQAGDDADGGVVLVQRRGQLFPRAGQLFAQVVRLEGEAVPLVLKGGQQRGYRRQRRRTRAGDARGADGEEVVGREGVAGAGLGAVLIDVLLDQSLLVNDAWGLLAREKRRERHGCGGYCDEPDFLDATGSCGASPETANGG